MPTIPKTLPVAMRLRDLRANYGAVRAVDGVSLDLHRGEIVALIGPNGSGKSTTLGIAAGILDPAAGTVELEGNERSADPARFARGIGFVPQDSTLYDELTVVQNLRFFGRLHGLRGFDLDARICRALVRANLTDRSETRAKTLSGGLKQRLGIAAALLHEPPVLLLDEPTTALDPASRESLFDQLQRLRDDGHAILLTTHHLDEAERGCDRIALLENGRLVAVGSPGAVLRSSKSGRNALFGHLRGRLPKFVERRIRQRLESGVELEIVGRRVRLSAWTPDDLGRALATVLSEGAGFDTFRTAAGRIEPTTRNAA